MVIRYTAEAIRKVIHPNTLLTSLYFPIFREMMIVFNMKAHPRVHSDAKVAKYVHINASIAFKFYSGRRRLTFLVRKNRHE